MARTSTGTGIPLWLLPNVFSLDAPLVALAWQHLLAKQFEIPLALAGRLVLGLTVWAIYLIDRLLDVRDPQRAQETARHRFYQNHRHAAFVLLAAVLAADIVALIELRPAVFHAGLVPLAGVIAYLIVVHANPRLRLPKEIAVALLFTAGTFVVAWARTTDPVLQLAGPALAFFCLCVLNLSTIELWESRELESRASEPHTAVVYIGKLYPLFAGSLILLGLLNLDSLWDRGIGLSAGATALLYATGTRFPLDLRRAAVDAVLLIPLLFLL